MELNCFKQRIGRNYGLALAAGFGGIFSQADTAASFARAILSKYTLPEAYGLPSASFVHPVFDEQEREKERLAMSVNILLTLNQFRKLSFSHTYEKRYYHLLCRQYTQLLTGLGQTFAGFAIVKEMEKCFLEICREAEGRENPDKTHREERWQNREKRQQEREQKLLRMLAEMGIRAERQEFTETLQENVPEVLSALKTGRVPADSFRRYDGRKGMHNDGLPSYSSNTAASSMVFWKSERARRFFWRVQRAPAMEQQLILAVLKMNSVVGLMHVLKTVEEHQWSGYAAMVQEQLKTAAEDREFLLSVSRKVKHWETQDQLTSAGVKTKEELTIPENTKVNEDKEQTDSTESAGGTEFDVYTVNDAKGAMIVCLRRWLRECYQETEKEEEILAQKEELIFRLNEEWTKDEERYKRIWESDKTAEKKKLEEYRKTRELLAKSRILSDYILQDQQENQKVQNGEYLMESELPEPVFIGAAFAETIRQMNISEWKSWVKDMQKLFFAENSEKEKIERLRQGQEKAADYGTQDKILEWYQTVMEAVSYLGEEEWGDFKKELSVSLKEFPLVQCLFEEKSDTGKEKQEFIQALARQMRGEAALIRQAEEEKKQIRDITEKAELILQKTEKTKFAGFTRLRQWLLEHSEEAEAEKIKNKKRTVREMNDSAVNDREIKHLPMADADETELQKQSLIDLFKREVQYDVQENADDGLEVREPFLHVIRQMESLAKLNEAEWKVFKEELAAAVEEPSFPVSAMQWRSEEKTKIREERRDWIQSLVQQMIHGIAAKTVKESSQAAGRKTEDEQELVIKENTVQGQFLQSFEHLRHWLNEDEQELQAAEELQTTEELKQQKEHLLTLLEREIRYYYPMEEGIYKEFREINKIKEPQKNDGTRPMFSDMNHELERYNQIKRLFENSKILSAYIHSDTSEVQPLTSFQKDNGTYPTERNANEQTASEQNAKDRNTEEQNTEERDTEDRNAEERNLAQGKSGEPEKKMVYALLPVPFVRFVRQMPAGEWKRWKQDIQVILEKKEPFAETIRDILTVENSDVWYQNVMEAVSYLDEREWKALKQEVSASFASGEEPLLTVPALLWAVKETSDIREEKWSFIRALSRQMEEEKELTASIQRQYVQYLVQHAYSVQKDSHYQIRKDSRDLLWEASRDLLREDSGYLLRKDSSYRTQESSKKAELRIRKIQEVLRETIRILEERTREDDSRMFFSVKDSVQAVEIFPSIRWLYQENNGNSGYNSNSGYFGADIPGTASMVKQKSKTAAFAGQETTIAAARQGAVSAADKPGTAFAAGRTGMAFAAGRTGTAFAADRPGLVFPADRRRMALAVIEGIRENRIRQLSSEEGKEEGFSYHPAAMVIARNVKEQGSSREEPVRQNQLNDLSVDLVRQVQKETDIQWKTREEKTRETNSENVQEEMENALKKLERQQKDLEQKLLSNSPEKISKAVLKKLQSQLHIDRMRHGM